MARFKDRVRELTRRHRGVSLEKMIADLNPFVRGWAGYFGFSQWRELPSLDGWIRRRLLASSGSSGRRAVSARRECGGFIDLPEAPPSGPSPLADPCRMRAGVAPAPFAWALACQPQGQPVRGDLQADRNRPL